MGCFKGNIFHCFLSTSPGFPLICSCFEHRWGVSLLFSIFLSFLSHSFPSKDEVRQQAKTHFHSLASPRKRAWEEQPQVTASPDPSTGLAELIYFSPSSWVPPQGLGHSQTSSERIICSRLAPSSQGCRLTNHRTECPNRGNIRLREVYQCVSKYIT